MYSTTEKHKELFGKSIVSIDGVSKDSIISGTKCHAYGKVVGHIESMKDGYRHTTFSSFYSKSFPRERGTKVCIVFSDSTDVTVKYEGLKNELYDTLMKRRKERLETRKQSFITSIISDSIAILDLNTFVLYQWFVNLLNKVLIVSKIH